MRERLLIRSKKVAVITFAKDHVKRRTKTNQDSLCLVVTIGDLS